MSAAGALLDSPTGFLDTMAITLTREAAEVFVAGNPFLVAGKLTRHRIRTWANMFAHRHD